jgi:hypothetical protein
MMKARRGIRSRKGSAPATARAWLILAGIKSNHQPGVVARLMIVSSPRPSYEDGLALFSPFDIE